LRWLFLAMVGLTQLSARGETSATPEAVKASYLMLFAGYTTWPTNTFASSNSPVVIGILGADPFGEVLDKTARAHKGKRPMEVRRVRTPEEAAQCHLVFISQAESRNETQWLAALSGKPLLTVGESDRAIDHGSVVGFVSVGNRLKFDVNWSAMTKSGLRIGAEMLESAWHVHGRPHTGQ